MYKRGVIKVHVHEWHDIQAHAPYKVPFLIMPQKLMRKLYNILSSYHTTTSGSTQNNSHFIYFVMASSGEESNSFLTSRTSLVIGRFKI